ncbi:hypothetical protein [Novosphingobium sp. fls2-241-R2A-195]|uniref:hypothetical protein n=1 Tax=Novosphingobium sp. fls2-241-R2A-195 TaxID=3040296 RepID=UPI00254ACCCE|nr:hypothetical protein [Novosphingobium sp. fls2-241-R2A-195]
MFLIVLASLNCAACASIDGAPKPVIDLRSTAEIPEEYKVATVTEAIGDELDTAKAKRWRNRTIAIYMAAMDARYGEFRKALAGESKGWNAGLDISVLGISSLGAVAKKSSNELAALAAFLSGTRNSLNKELYFDRTLPALIATMDASRTRVRSTIMGRMRDDISQYPMELAFSDLASYELSASIDAAIQQVTADASVAARAADEKYKNAVASCNPIAALRPNLQRLNNYVYDLAAGADNGTPPAGSPDQAKLDRLAKIAVAVDAEPSTTATTKAEASTQADAIIDATAGICSVDGLETLFATMKGATGETVP